MLALLRSLWDEPRPPDAPARVWRDWMLVGGLPPLVLLEAVLRPDMPWPAASVILTLGIVPLLLWRRTRPLLMVAIGFAACALAGLLTTGEPPGTFTMAFVLLLPYALFRWGSGREAAIGIPIMFGKLAESTISGEFNGGELFGASAILFAAMALGGALRYRAWARRRELFQVTLLERERLARDLHDTVAHHVSAIAIRAQAGLATAGADPGAATEALRVIEAEASRSLAEMRTIVRALRRSEQADPAPPAGQPHRAQQPDPAVPAELAAPAGSPGLAGAADPATSAGLAGSAEPAGPAELAGAADPATSAGLANSADPADSAGLVGSAGLAGAADLATSAGLANSANLAGSAGLAGSADFADLSRADLMPGPRVADLEELAGRTRAGPPVRVEIIGDVDDLPPSVSAALYRLAQESVTNARRHARHATGIEVRVDADDTSVQLRVSDDGDTSLVRPAASSGYGLVGMVERATLLGGTCEAGPDPDRGWTVTAVLPRAGWAS